MQDNIEGSGLDFLKARRWGQSEDGRPVYDGHSDMSYYRAAFRPVGADAWRMEEPFEDWLGNAHYFKRAAPPIGHQGTLL